MFLLQHRSALQRADLEKFRLWIDPSHFLSANSVYNIKSAICGVLFFPDDRGITSFMSSTDIPSAAPIDDGSDETRIEIRYGETDQMGYAHHATAVLWLEYGRVHWLRKRGLRYRDLEANGVLLPVVNLSIKYHAPGKFEDQLAILTRLVDLGKTRITFDNQVYRIENEGSRTLLVSGTVELVCLNKSGRIQRLPRELQRIWEQIGDKTSD